MTKDPENPLRNYFFGSMETSAYTRSRDKCFIVTVKLNLELNYKHQPPLNWGISIKNIAIKKRIEMPTGLEMRGVNIINTIIAEHLNNCLINLFSKAIYRAQDITLQWRINSVFKQAGLFDIFVEIYEQEKESPSYATSKPKPEPEPRPLIKWVIPKRVTGLKHGRRCG